jgi:hypothetical protein
MVIQRLLGKVACINGAVENFKIEDQDKWDVLRKFSKSNVRSGLIGIQTKVKESEP